MSAPKVTTNAAVPGRAVFVIASNDTAVHVYRDAQSLVDAKEVETDRLDAIEFFDIRGYRLAPVVNDKGVLTGLRDTGEQPDMPRVQARLCAVRRHLAATVAARVAKAVPTVTAEEALSRLPELDGKSLPECYVLLEATFSHAYGDGEPGSRHDGGWWHNLWAH
jgi:hypothetical protein